MHLTGYPPLRLVRSVILGFLASLLASCTAWSEWQAYGFQPPDPPYADGTVAELKRRARACPPCPTGSESQYALFFKDSHLYLEEIGEGAEKLLNRVAKQENWPTIGKDYYGREFKFAPVRIFIPSIEPLVVITIPWQYQTDTTASGDRVFNESNKLSAMGYKGFILRYWPRTIRQAFELKGVLPPEAQVARVITVDFDETVALPVKSGDVVSNKTGTQVIHFRRADDRRVLLSFSPRHK